MRISNQLEAFTSYEKIPVSCKFKRAIAIKLSKLPDKFRSVKSHAKICAYYSCCIIENIKMPMKIQRELPVWAHFCRASFKPVNRILTLE